MGAVMYNIYTSHSFVLLSVPMSGLHELHVTTRAANTAEKKSAAQ